MERIHAYQCSDGALRSTAREWAEREFFLLLCGCSMNATTEEASELLDKFEAFAKIHSEFDVSMKYGEGRTDGSVRYKDERNNPKPATGLIPLIKEDDDGRTSPEDGGTGLQEPAPEF